MAQPWIGLGAMRLSTVDGDRAKATLRAALEAGVNFIDTADVYGASDDDRHGNERWLAEHLPSGLTVATKGGLVRGPGPWRPDGRAKSLRAACARSRSALDRTSIDLYLLHAVDPRTSLDTSARALQRLRAEGWVRRVGLCNVGVDQVRQVQAHVPVAAVQVAVSPQHGQAIRSGVVEYCRDQNIDVLAHSPFGGPRRAARLGKDPVLKEVAARHHATPHAVVLAWLLDLGVTPLPGPTQPAHAADIGRAVALSLTDGDRRDLDARFPLGVWLRTPRRARRPPAGVKGEVAIIMGFPAAGKTTAVSAFVESGYTRFNRDADGGTLAKLHRRLDAFLAQGGGRAVLDNTYGTRALRHEVLEVAWRHGRSVRCIWLDTSIEDAQLNAVSRLWSRFGHLPRPDEWRVVAKTEPNLFGPEVLRRFQVTFEPPHEEEGFAAIDRRSFVRRPWPAGESGTLIAEDVVQTAAVQTALAKRPGPVGVIAWWPDTDASARATREAEVAQALGGRGVVFACVHGVRDRCWCLLPLPGLGFAALMTLKLDPQTTVWIGASAAHQRAAERLGLRYVDAAAGGSDDRDGGL